MLEMTYNRWIYYLISRFPMCHAGSEFMGLKVPFAYSVSLRSPVVQHHLKGF